ncbi:MAG: peptidylprolyl isomerase [Methanosarcinaceae archaeon]|nr:peptidylprolyl isomerase [Methanosarcinaceae archaeon]MDD4496722.1 peptidylprolyl isomerase [Methanosarcinaceae archaeon]
MDDSKTVETGDYILVDYAAKFEDGTVFDTSLKELAKEAGIYEEGKNYGPLFFRVKGRQVITGLDEGVAGMKVGEEKTLMIPPENAYGAYKDYLVQKIPLARLELETPPEPGEKITTPGGKEVRVLASDEKSATLDFNNELAGKALVMEVKLVSFVGGAESGELSGINPGEKLKERTL